MNFGGCGKLSSLIIALVLAAAIAGCAPQQDRTRLAPLTRPTTRLATQPFTRPASRPSYVVTDPSEKTLSPQAFYFRTATTTFPELPKTIATLLKEVSQSAAARGVTITGPPILVYRNALPSATKSFVLEAGFPTSSDAKPAGKDHVRTLSPMRCAGVVHTGPASTIDKAYDRLVPAIEAAKLRRTAETREIYLRWNGPDAPDNQVLIAIGVE